MASVDVMLSSALPRVVSMNTESSRWCGFVAHVSDIPGLDGLGRECAVFRDLTLTQFPGGLLETRVHHHPQVPDFALLFKMGEAALVSVGLALHVYSWEEKKLKKFLKKSSIISYCKSWKEKMFGWRGWRGRRG